MPRIRPIAICVFRHGDKILAQQGEDWVKQNRFYRPLGGRIEFGEPAHQTIVREIREEIGAEIHDVKYLFTLENIFTYNGETGHEIVLVFDAKFDDPQFYTQDTIQAYEDDEVLFQAVWKSLSEFGGDKDILYPEGLLERLKEQ
jgi:8-oxo-dGTP pyrophosphatase MutT (NUDIX family)